MSERRRVGPFRVPEKVGDPSPPAGRDQIVRAAKRHFRDVAAGPRSVVDPDASVRRVPPRPAGSRSMPLPRRPFYVDPEDEFDD